jgi:hypothetical protein
MFVTKRGISMPKTIKTSEVNEVETGLKDMAMEIATAISVLALLGLGWKLAIWIVGIVMG